jgi:glycine hydroxymethyltransferase
MKDKIVEKLIKAEEARQKKMITLIASENYTSKDVDMAVGSKFANKYSEGYPGKRYYKGQENTDKIELLAQERALKLFGLNKKTWAVNVQALSGSPMNTAVYFALLHPGDTIMGMALSAGGHLTHGHKVSISGKYFKSVQFGVDPNTEDINYTEVEKLAVENKPKIIVAGFTAYPKTVNWKKFREIADKVGAYLMVDMSHIAGLVAGKAYPSPFPFADIVTTTTHKTLRGPRGAMIFSRLVPTKDSLTPNPSPQGEGSSAKVQIIAEKIDKAVFPGLQGGPHMNNIAGIAVALNEALDPKFKAYAKQVVKNAKVMASQFKKLGYRVVAGGTDSHLLLVDVWMDGKGLTGEQAATVLEKNGIVVNKNTVPGEKRSPFDPSGLRLGSAAETTRGWKEKQFISCVNKMDAILKKEVQRLAKINNTNK